MAHTVLLMSLCNNSTFSVNHLYKYTHATSLCSGKLVVRNNTHVSRRCYGMDWLLNVNYSILHSCLCVTLPCRPNNPSADPVFHTRSNASVNDYISNALPSLLKVQATVVGFLAAVAAVVLGWIPEGKFQMSHAVLLCSSSVATAFIASLLQGKHTHTHTRSDNKLLIR